MEHDGTPPEYVATTDDGNNSTAPEYDAGKYDRKERLVALYDRAVELDPALDSTALGEIVKLIAPELGIKFTCASPGKILQLTRKALSLGVPWRVVTVDEGNFDEWDVVPESPA